MNSSFQSEGSFMICGFFAASVPGNPNIIEGIKQQDKVWVAVCHLKPSRIWWCSRTMTPQIKVNQPKDWLQTQEIHLLGWLSPRPELNPVEMPWKDTEQFARDILRICLKQLSRRNCPNVLDTVQLGSTVIKRLIAFIRRHSRCVRYSLFRLFLLLTKGGKCIIAAFRKNINTSFSFITAFFIDQKYCTPKLDDLILLKEWNEIELIELIVLCNKTTV